MKIFNKNINLNKFANIALVLAILLFALSLLTNVIVRSRKNSTNLKISETQKENTLSPENNEEKQQPLIIIVEENPDSKKIVSIKNPNKNEVEIRAFSIEAVVEKPIKQDKKDLIEIEESLEKMGFSFPIESVEISNNQTTFKISGFINNNPLKIQAGEKIKLVTIDTKQEDLILGEETKIINNSGESLDFVEEK